MIEANHKILFYLLKKNTEDQKWFIEHQGIKANKNCAQPTWEIDLHYSWQSTLYFVQAFPEFKTIPQRHIPSSFMICVPQVLL